MMPLGSTLRQAVEMHQRGQIHDAQRLYEQILAVQPRHFDALHLLGVIAAATGNPERAVKLISAALSIDPNNAIAHNNRGAALQELGRWEAALAEFDRAIALQSAYSDAHFNRGNVMKDLGRWEDALSSYERALVLNGNHPEVHCNRGIALVALGRHEAALASYDRAIALRGDFAAAFYNRGNLLCELKQWDAAIAEFDRATALKTDYAEAFSNRGFALLELQRTAEALASTDRAIGIKPDYAEAHCNRGGILRAMNRLSEALASYDRAIALNADYAFAHVNRALVLLLLGEYERGWADHEWRWKDKHSWIVNERRYFAQPLWLGEDPIAGRTILLQSEQGYGDTLQFCRFATLVAARGAQVILEVPKALANLLQSLHGVAQVVVQGEPLPPFDCYCPLLSLPLALKTTLSTIPSAVPYLASGEERRERWKHKLGDQHRKRVGIVWSSGIRPERPDLMSANGRRNIALTKFMALRDQRIEFYSLQKGQHAESELSELVTANRDELGIKDFSADLHDFANTAALIEQMDLVISVDTSTAHLAGALGKPVWVLLRFDACWRWLTDRDDSPWYPTARLYRQRRAGDWDDVLRRVRDDLLASL